MKLASVSTSIALAFVLILPMVATGCSTQTTVDNSVDTAIATVATGGVAVYDSYAAKAPIATIAGPVSAMRLTRWMMRNMVGQAKSGMGMTGAALDAFARKPAAKGTPSFSAFLGAWLIRAQGPLATYAASFMPTNTNYRHTANIVFPTLVVTLFIADAARPAHPRPATGFEWERLIAAPASAAGACSTVTDFVSGVVDDVTKALQAGGDGFFATLWNIVVTTVINGVVSVIKVALAPVLNIIKTVASVLAMVTIITSSLQPWTVKVVADPQKLTLLKTPIDGKFVATVSGSDIPWPDDLKDCSKTLAGVDLDSLTSTDAPVSWETSGQIPEHANVVDKQQTVAADKTATLTYRTVPLDHEEQPECSTLQSSGNVFARATVVRQDVQRLQAALTKAALDQLPDFVQKLLLPSIQPWIDSMTQGFANLLAAPVSGADAVQLMTDEKDPAKCTPAPAPPTPVPSVAPTGTTNDVTIVGTWSCVMPQHIVASGIAVDVDTHVRFAFSAKGTAVVSFPMGAVGTFGAGSGNVQANQKMTAGAPGTYSYTPTGAHTGTLHFINQVSSGDEHLTFSGKDAYSTIVTSPQSNKSLPMHCTRS